MPLGIKALPSVPLFLAISGFLILQSYERSASVKEFVLKRVLRVGPAFLLSFCLVVALFGIEALKPIVVYWACGGLIPMKARNGAVWSLSWEEVHYALLAILYTLGAYRRTTVVWSLLGMSLVLMLCLHPRLYYEAGRPLALPVAFFIGNLCYLYKDRLSRIGPYMLIGFVVMMALRISLPLTISDINFWTGVNLAAVTVTGSVAMLWAAASFRPRIPAFPDFSYGCYLYHVPLIIWLRIKGLEMYWLAVLLPAMCVFSWYFVEKPALRLKPARPVTAT